MKSILKSALFFLMVLSAGALRSQNWTGAVDSEWNNASNWDSWPLNGENVTIDPANYIGAMAAPSINNPSDFIPDRLFIEGAAVLMIDAPLVVADRTIITGPASVVMAGGSFICDRLVLDAGGTFALNGGTVSLTNTLALADGDLDGDSRFTQTGGSVNLTGELGFECEAGIFEPTYVLTAGSLFVNGDVVWFGALPGGGRPRLMVNGGSAQFNGSILNGPNSTVDLHISMTSGTLVTNGPDIHLTHSTDSIIQSGGTFRVDNNATIENDGVWSALGGSIHVDQQTEIRGVGSYQFHDLTISPGAVLQHRDPSEISVTGDWVNMGAFEADVNSVAFVGSALQTVSTTAFHGMRIYNSAGISLSGPSTVGGALVLDEGVIHTQMTDLLTLIQNATATSGTPTSFIDGPLRKIGNDAFVFPIGKNGHWMRLGISAVNDQNTEFTSEFFDNGYFNTTSLTSPLTGVSTSEHWTLTRSGTSDGAQVELFWEDAGSSSISNCSLLTLARWSGGSWVSEVSTITGSCSGNDAGTVESVNVLTDHDVLTFGTTDGTIGMKEVRSIQTLRPYPQPADQWSLIPAEPNAEFDLVDAMGRKVDVAWGRTQEGIRIWTSGLSAGSYELLLRWKGSSIAHGSILVIH